MIKKVSINSTTDDAGNVVIHQKAIVAPICLILDNTHTIYSFFWAGDYWYARVTSAYDASYYPIKNTQITGVLLYVDY